MPTSRSLRIAMEQQDRRSAASMAAADCHPMGQSIVFIFEVIEHVADLGGNRGFGSERPQLENVIWHAASRSVAPNFRSYHSGAARFQFTVAVYFYKSMLSCQLVHKHAFLPGRRYRPIPFTAKSGRRGHECRSSLCFGAKGRCPMAHTRRLPNLPRAGVACADRVIPQALSLPPRTSSVGQRPQQRHSPL